MSDTAVLSVRLSTELRERLAALGESTGRSKSFLAAEAIADYVETQEWQLAAIEQGIAEADAGGPFVDHEQVGGWLRSWGTDRERGRPR